MAVLPYMVPVGPQTHITESYVSSPPALVITDERGARWCLGTEYARMDDSPNGEFAFNVVRNGMDTGMFASRIERRNGKIRIFTRDGWRIWNGRCFL
jgi:hypothetical protein